MTDYRLAGDFTKCATGPFTNAEKVKVWGPVFSDFDPDGSLYSIVADDRFPGSRACRMKYPKGSFGMKDQQYYLKLASPKQPVYIEFMWLFENNFSFHTPNANKTCGGKIAPCIQWGPIDGPEEGTRPMIWWNGSGSNYPPAGGTPVFSPSCQDQATGKQWIQPPKYTARIVLEQLYTFKIGCMGGPNGWAKYWLDGVKLAEAHGDFRYSADDDVYFDFAYFSGGNTHPDNEPERDSFARHGGCRIWTGAENWEAGNGDTDTGGDGGGAEPGPTPPNGQNSTAPFSLAVGETKIFRANFGKPAQGNVTWALSPNIVTWGAEAGPNWSALKVTGKTVGTASLVATDSGTGKSTKPIQIEVTETPQPSQGICTVEEP